MFVDRSGKAEIVQVGLMGLDGKALDLWDRTPGGTEHHKPQALVCMSSDHRAA